MLNIGLVICQDDWLILYSNNVNTIYGHFTLMCRPTSDTFDTTSDTKYIYYYKFTFNCESKLMSDTQRLINQVI